MRYDSLTLDQMRTFVVVAESGSFRAGAAKLERVQSAISYAISKLESELGVQLFDRTGHRPLLTEAGRALLANVHEVLLRVDGLRARARGIGRGVELELAVIVDTLFPIAMLAAALHDVRTLYPTVALTVAVEPMGGPLAGLLARKYAAAITAAEDSRDSAVVVEALSAVCLVAVVSPQHPLALHATRLRVEPSELADHLQIVQVDPASRSDGRSSGLLSPHICRVSSQDTKHALIVAGVGWGRLPLWQIDRDLREGRLVRLATRPLGEDSETVKDLYFSHRVDAPPGPAARALRDSLKRLCRETSAV